MRRGGCADTSWNSQAQPRFPQISRRTRRSLLSWLRVEVKEALRITPILNCIDQRPHQEITWCQKRSRCYLRTRSFHRSREMAVYNMIYTGRQAGRASTLSRLLRTTTIMYLMMICRYPHGDPVRKTRNMLSCYKTLCCASFDIPSHPIPIPALESLNAIQQNPVVYIALQVLQIVYITHIVILLLHRFVSIGLSWADFVSE